MRNADKVSIVQETVTSHRVEIETSDLMQLLRDKGGLVPGSKVEIEVSVPYDGWGIDDCTIIATWQEKERKDLTS